MNKDEAKVFIKQLVEDMVKRSTDLITKTSVSVALHPVQVIIDKYKNK